MVVACGCVGASMAVSMVMEESCGTDSAGGSDAGVGASGRGVSSCA